MRIGYLDLQVFLEGLDVTRFVSEYDITFNKKISSRADIMLRQGVSTEKDRTFENLKYGTLLHIYFCDPTKSPKWYLMYEGSLLKKRTSFDGSSEIAELNFVGTDRILDNCKFTKVSDKNGAVMDTFASDVLYVNMGLKAYSSVDKQAEIDKLEAKNKELDTREKVLRKQLVLADEKEKEKLSAEILEINAEIQENEITIENLKRDQKEGTSTAYGAISGPSNIVEQYVVGDLWNEIAAKNAGAGFATLLQMLLKSMTNNSPYFKVIDESLRYIDQFKIYGHDSIKDILDSLNAFSASYLQSMRNPSDLISYRDLLNMYLRYNFLKHTEVGIPILFDGKPVQSMIIPDMDYTTPPACNVLYPDEFNNYTIDENYDAEITRARVTGPGIEIGQDFFGNGGTTVPVFLAPSNELEFSPISSYGMDDRKISAYLKFTKEEMYRGVNAYTSSGDVFEFSWIKTDTSTAKAAEKVYLNDALLDPKKVTDILNKEYQAMYRYISDHTFLEKRLEGRGGGSITVNHFNPEWVIGLPGLIVTEESGPILVMFDMMNLAGSANGSCRSTIYFSKPRYVKDVIPMDYAIPEWFHPDFNRNVIGQQFYEKFGTTAISSGSASTPMTGKMAFTKTIENAAIKLANNFFKNGTKINRNRAFIEKDQYIRYMYYDRTEQIGKYRKASKLNAFSIAAKAALDSKEDFSFLQCPFVYERGISVKEWLGLSVNLSLFTLEEGNSYAYTDALGTEYSPRYVKPETASNTVSNPTGKVVDTGRVEAITAGDFDHGHWYDSAHPFGMNDGRDFIGKTLIDAYRSLDNPKGKRFLNKVWRSDIKDIFETHNPATGFIWPCLYGAMSNHFPGAGRDNNTRSHDGIDIGTYERTDNMKKRIYAVLPGRVTGTRNNGNTNGGIIVQLEHDGYKTTYMHFASINVRVGDQVSQGQVLGIMGDTGSPGQLHLHFEVLKYNPKYKRYTLVHPFEYLKWEGMFR